MSNIDQAIQVETTVEIDWAELGRVFADQSSDAQAKFFMGFYEGVTDEQVAYIGADKIFDGNRSYVSGVFENLSYFISARGA